MFVLINLVKNLILLYFLIYFLFIIENFFNLTFLDLIKFFVIVTLFFFIYFNFYHKFFKGLFIEKINLCNLVFSLRPLKFLKNCSKENKVLVYLNLFEPFLYINRIYLNKVFCEKKKILMNKNLFIYFFFHKRNRYIIGSELIRYFYLNYFYFKCYYVFLLSRNLKITLTYSLTQFRMKRLSIIKKKNEL